MCEVIEHGPDAECLVSRCGRWMLGRCERFVASRHAIRAPRRFRANHLRSFCHMSAPSRTGAPRVAPSYSARPGSFTGYLKRSSMLTCNPVAKRLRVLRLGLVVPASIIDR
jgi:hypothetical protein